MSTRVGMPLKKEREQKPAPQNTEVNEKKKTVTKRSRTKKTK